MPFDPEDPRLTAYALGELEDGEVEEMEILLSGSPEGRRFIEEVRDTARLLSDTLAGEHAPGLSPKHLKAIDFELAPAALGMTSRPSQDWQHWAGYGIAASMLLGFGLSAAWMVMGGKNRPARLDGLAMATSPTSSLPAARPDDWRFAAKDANPDASQNRALFYSDEMELRSYTAPVAGAKPARENARPPAKPELNIARKGKALADPGALASSVASSPASPTLDALASDDKAANSFNESPASRKRSDFSVPTSPAPSDTAASTDGFYGRPAAPLAKKAEKATVTPLRTGRGLGGQSEAAGLGMQATGMQSQAGSDRGALGGGMPAAGRLGRDYVPANQGVATFTRQRTNEEFGAKLPAGSTNRPMAQAEGLPKLYAQAGQADKKSGRAGLKQAGQPDQQGASSQAQAQARYKLAEGKLARLEQLAERSAISGKELKDAKDEMALAGKQDFEALALRDGEAKQGEPLKQHVEAEVQLNLAVVDALADNAVGAEGYTDFQDNTFKSAALAPLSTFSIDVDTASYSNIRRFLRDENRLPPPAAVRLEEMVNYFPYGYQAPTTTTPDAPPFSVNVELSRCPWNAGNRLARIGLKGKVDAKRSVSNLVFLIDVSGSMDQPNKLPYVQASMRMLTEQLGENDRVSIVVYAGAAGLVMDSVGGYDKPRIAEAIDRLKAGGSTAGGAGIDLAYKVAQKNFVQGGVNRVILATDGDFNVGISDDKALEALAAEKAKSGVFLTVLGFGMGNLKDSKLKGFADKGNGNYAYIDNLPEARKVLVDQIGSTLVTIAKDVKIQVDFNAAKVGSYRLLGYENRMLETKHFDDDTKDAGEIGAGHTVTALYELTPPGKDLATNEPESRYARNKAKANVVGDPDSNELFTVRLRYKAPDGDTSKLIEHPVTNAGKDFAQASEDFKFASSVAAFGMMLRNNKDKGTATFDGLLEWAESSKGKDLGGYRKEFCELVRKAKSLKNPDPGPALAPPGPVK
ncbi:MAG: uncharacterized protein JWN86_3151 [Planctomycetota bacterium]|nr:uncharacterized protein [Planctomycetota bacterium]